VTVVQDHPRHRHHASITAAARTATPNDVFFRQRRQQTTSASLDDDDYICAHGRRRGDGKFAHVVFATSNEMKRVMKRLVVNVNISEQRPLRLEDGVIHRLLSVGRTKVDDDNNNNDDEERLRGIHAVVARAHNSISRRELMRLCNEVMTSYKRDEEGMINEANLAKDRPDEDGFVTVTYNKKKTSTSSSMTMMTTTSSIGLEEDGIGVGGGGRQRGGGGRGMGDGSSSKRNCKRKSNNNIMSSVASSTCFSSMPSSPILFLHRIPPPPSSLFSAAIVSIALLMLICGNENERFVSLRQSTKTILGQITKFMPLRLVSLCFAFLCF
jgi:hypothetical protein